MRYGSTHIETPRRGSARRSFGPSARDAARLSMTNLFRHRGGAVVVAVVLSIAGWAIVIGLAHLLWQLF
jgi:hypothetical protein